MTKAVGPKHKPDLWKVRAKSQVFSTAGLSAPLSYSISFLSFMIPPFLTSPLPLLLSLPVSLQSMLTLSKTDFSISKKKKKKKREIKVLDSEERGRENTERHTVCGKVGSVVGAVGISRECFVVVFFYYIGIQHWRFLKKRGKKESVQWQN